MKNNFPEIKPLGEQAILLNFPAEISEELLQHILFLKEYLQQTILKEEVEVTNTYCSLLINYHSPIEDVYGEVEAVQKLVGEANVQKTIQRSLFHIPVCYEEEFALDIEYISEVKKLDRREIIELHTAPVYTVYFLGFLPGFLYLGGLDKKLVISRKDQPRLDVKKGAVGIGENQTGIYPQESPGGWQILGNCPVPLFNPKKHAPCEISAGDKLKFYSLNIEEYHDILKAVKKGDFQFKKEEWNG